MHALNPLRSVQGGGDDRARLLTYIELRDNPPDTITSLADTVPTSRQTVSKILNELREEDYIDGLQYTTTGLDALRDVRVSLISMLAEYYASVFVGRSPESFIGTAESQVDQVFPDRRHRPSSPSPRDLTGSSRTAAKLIDAMLRDVPDGDAEGMNSNVPRVKEARYETVRSQLEPGQVIEEGDMSMHIVWTLVDNDDVVEVDDGVFMERSGPEDWLDERGQFMVSEWPFSDDYIGTFADKVFERDDGYTFYEPC